MQQPFGFLLTEKTIKALTLAEKAHHNQKDYAEIPYILHVISVAQHVPQEEDYVCVALLHDILEDTAISNEQINNTFGEYIAELVGILTRNHHKTYSEYIEICANNPITRIVKIADIFDHLAPYRKNTIISTLHERYTKALETLVNKEPQTYTNILEKIL